MDDKTQGLIRHILTIVGGFAVSRGYERGKRGYVRRCRLSTIGVIWSWRSKS
jgi:hypothetical protein